MGLLKRFYDGAKNDLYVVIDFENGTTILKINALAKSFFSPSETCILNGHGYMLLNKAIGNVSKVLAR